MKLQITLIRNGITAGGLEGRFMGLSGEGLTAAGRAELEHFAQSGHYPQVARVFVSPVRRCMESARIIYPDQLHAIEKGLRALDYGDFENRTYGEILGDERFLKWADSPHLLACPGGEEPHDFTVRCVVTFDNIVKLMDKKKIPNVALVTHQGVIKAILNRYCLPRSVYSAWKVCYGGGYTLDFNTESSSARILREF
ncbi:histidine phosphatase family protein [Oscillospiraceae bacterium MB08-C2-2]|nr:histidine phosphatase family protein [Oscillospiraceae bacterium MB08-C2-2]